MDRVVVTGARERERDPYGDQVRDVYEHAGLNIRSQNAEGQQFIKFPAEQAICPTSAKPVVLATGEKRLSHTDFSIDTAHGFNVTRTYESLRVNGRGISPGWSLSVDAVQLANMPELWTCNGSHGYCGARVAYLNLADGSIKRINFSEAGFGEPRDGYVSGMGPMSYDPSSQLAVLYVEELKQIWRFNPAGFLSTIESSTGVVLRTYTYNGVNQLIRVTNIAGQAVQLGYDDWRLVSVTAPNGAIWRYAYTVAGALASATDPTGVVTSYFYEVPGNPFLLTGYAVNGVRATR